MHDGKWDLAACGGGRKWEGGTTTVQSERRDRESSFQHVAAVVQLQLQLQLSERVSGAAPGSLVWGLAACSGGASFCFLPVRFSTCSLLPLHLNLNLQTVDTHHIDGLTDGWMDGGWWNG